MNFASALKFVCLNMLTTDVAQDVVDIHSQICNAMALALGGEKYPEPLCFIAALGIYAIRESYPRPYR